MPSFRTSLLEWIWTATLVAVVGACDSGKGGEDKPAAEDGAAKDGAVKDGAAKDAAAKDGEAKGAEAVAKADDEAKADGADELTPPEKVVADAVAQAEKEAGVGKVFDSDFAKRACEFISPELVAEVFEIPAAEIDTHKIMGCIQSWRHDGKMVEAKLMTMQVHKTVESAELWFSNATATKTKAEMDAQFEVVKGKLDEREELDTKLKKGTAKGLTDIAKMSTPEGGIAYEDVPGIGDQARISSQDGSLWVRLGNATFHLAAYKGDEQPRVPFDPHDPKAIAKAAMEGQKKWLADTHDQRRKDVLALAPRVLEAIDAALDAG